jgi:hypothetical protein
VARARPRRGPRAAGCAPPAPAPRATICASSRG